MKDDSSRDLLGRDGDDGVARSPGPRDDLLLGMLNKLVRIVHHASRTGDDYAPTIAEGVVYAIDLKTNRALRFELRRLLHCRVKEHFTVRKPKIHRECHGATGCAKDDPPHSSGFEVRTTLCWRQGFENGPRQRACPTQRPVPVAPKEARGSGEKDSGDRCQRPLPQLHIGVLFEVLKKTRIDACLPG